MEKALFDWPITLQYDVKAKYRLISRKFFGHEVFSPERSLNQPKATRVCIRAINQSNRSISVRWLFLYCWRVVISRSYENRFKRFHVNEVSGAGNFSAGRNFVRCRVDVTKDSRSISIFPFLAKHCEAKMKNAPRKQNRRHYQPCLYLTLQ